VKVWLGGMNCRLFDASIENIKEMRDTIHGDISACHSALDVAALFSSRNWALVLSRCPVIASTITIENSL